LEGHGKGVLLTVMDEQEGCESGEVAVSLAEAPAAGLHADLKPRAPNVSERQAA
jgi:hypothetical protein